MRYITIVQGAYGHRRAPGITETKTPTDDPFAVHEAEAARLVKLGVAKLAAAPKGDPDPGEKLDTPPVTPPGEKPEYDADMKPEELRALLKAVGLSAPVGTTKVAMVAELDAHYGAVPKNDPGPGEDKEPNPGEGGDQGNPEGDDEGPPLLDAELPVT